MKKQYGEMTEMMAKEIIDWCSKNIGISKYQDINTLSVRQDARINTLGLYNPNTNVLIFNPKRHPSFLEFVDTIIHEYVHFTQNIKNYSKLNKKYGYNNNPYEIEAIKVAESNRLICIDEIFGGLV